MQPAPLVYINAFPTPGNLAVSRALLTLLPRPAILIDNLQGMVGRVSEASRTPLKVLEPNLVPQQPLDISAKNKRLVRCRPCGIEGKDLDKIVIVSDWQMADENGENVAVGYRDAARRDGRVFIPIILTSAKFGSTGETGHEKQQGNVTTNVASAQQPFAFGIDEEMVFDISNMAAEEAAGKIARWIWWVGEFMSWGDDSSVDP